MLLARHPTYLQIAADMVVLQDLGDAQIDLSRAALAWLGH